MKYLVVLALLLSSCLAQNSSESITVQIAADVNRDGTVDFSSDEAGEDDWSRELGALFLNNCDSDQDSGRPDHEDAIVNGRDDVDDLAVVKIAAIPDMPPDGKVSIRLDAASAQRVRLFLKTGTDSFSALSLTEEANLPGERLRREELELRIEADSFASKDWNGMATLTLNLRAGGSVLATDSVVLRVAPFILLSNLQRGLTTYVREIPGRNEEMLRDLETLVPRTDSILQIIPAGSPYRPNDVWLQDCVEIGYSAMPGKHMSVALKANRDRSLDQLARTTLLSRDLGFLQIGSYREPYARGRGGNGWLDWYGNLEVTAPVADYPLGRIYYGFNPEGPSEASLNPEIIAMLDAQGVQGPALGIDTGWLMIKHVDEVISFLPGPEGEKRFSVMVVDPESMLSLLRKWQSRGLGKNRLLENFREDATVDSLLDDSDIIQHNTYLQEQRIAPTIDLMIRELGLAESDFIRIPALFDRQGRAIFPNMVNSLILNGHIFIADPDGPVVDGRDLLQLEMTELLKELPLVPHFLDDRQYHRWSGNVHCATNVRREGFSPSWWQ